MANTDYKPLWTGGGGGGSCMWIVTTTKKLPNPGNSNTLYICTDTGEQKCWDQETKTYKTFGSMSGVQQSYPGGRKDFPPLGEEGKCYIDGITGKKYIWNSKIGHPVARLTNFITANATQPDINMINGTVSPLIGSDSNGDYETLQFPSTVNIDFLDPFQPDATLIKRKPIKPIVRYYNPDVKPVINLDDLPSVVYEDTFVVFVPKTYNPLIWRTMYWDLRTYVATHNPYNYAFYISPRVTGSYIQIDA